MHAGIGASGAMHSHRLIGNFAQDFFKGFLHAWHARLLRLPAFVADAAELYTDCKTLHIHLSLDFSLANASAIGLQRRIVNTF